MVLNKWPSASSITEELESRIVLVTPAMAEQKRQTAKFERQRNMRENNTRYLATEMQEGRYMEGMPIIICILPNNTERLINGNHTLEAIIRYGAPQKLTVIYRRVESLEVIGRNYAVLDMHHRRSATDRLRATDMLEIPNATKVFSAIGVINNGMGQLNNRGKENISLKRMDQMESFREAAMRLDACFEKGSTEAVKILKLAPIMAVALVTLEDQPEIAFSFWHRAAQENELSREDPVRVMLEFLKKFKKGQQGGPKQQTIRARAATLAWNAAFSNRTIKFIKPFSFENYRLLGTRYERGLGNDTSVDD